MALSLDPVGLESNIYIVCRDGNPICHLDLDWYPGEILVHEMADYDILCAFVELENA